MDCRIFRLVWHEWLRPDDSQRGTWIKNRYFQQQGSRHGVFTGTLFTKQDKPLATSVIESAYGSIREGMKIRSVAHPYAPSWELHLGALQRWKRKQTLAGRKRIGYLWEDQGDRCVVCRQPLLAEESAW